MTCAPPSIPPAHDAPTRGLTVREHAIVAAFLDAGTYKAAAAALDVSIGTVYNAVYKAGVRKNEARIRQTAAQRAAEQDALLRFVKGQTVTADALDYLRSLPNDSVAMHLTSIPYNLGKRYGEAAGADQERHLAYHGWLMQIVSEMTRTLKPGGVVFLQVGTTKDDDGNRVPLDILLFEDLRAAGLTFQNRICWPVHHGLTPKRRLAERYEMALVFSKGDVAAWNPSAARRPQKNPGKRAFHGPQAGRLSGHPLGAWPEDIWGDINHLGHNNAESVPCHPAQFPIALPLRVILLWTLPGDLVVDTFCGTGSTHIAAVRAGRAFSGCDLFYDNVRAERTHELVADTFSPLPGVTAESAALWAAEARRVDVTAAPTTSATEDQLILTFC